MHVRMRTGFPLLALFVQLLIGCAPTKNDEVIEVTILQINDVYEIEPVAGGKLGGLARVAHLRKELLAKNPNTFTMLAGDFFSPSALGTAKVDGKALDGKQMVAVLNALPLDFATFGNHEFDLDKDAFFERMEEVEYTWVSCNVFDESSKPYQGVASSKILTIGGPGKTSFRLGITGITIASNDKAYVSYTNPMTSLKQEVATLTPQTDAIVAITHLDFVDDLQVAKDVPELSLIIGGHDHENMFFQRGENWTPIAKADANAKSVFVHQLRFHTKTKELTVSSELIPITIEIPSDPDTQKVVDEWVQKGFEGFRKDGFKPNEIVAEIDFDFDGLESSVRTQPTNLTRFIADAMMKTDNGNQMAMFNAGSIRIDDKITAGTVTQYDVLRVLPFPGKVVTVEIEGSLLTRALEQGSKSQLDGSYLQTTANVTSENNQWSLDGTPIDSSKTYRIAMNDFLAKGNEKPLSYLNINEPGSGIELVDTHQDVRQAVIESLKARYSADL